MTQKNLIQKKKLGIYLQVTHGLHAVHLRHQKTNGTIIEEKTVWKSFVKILKNQGIKIINYETKSYKKQKVYYVCKKEFCTDENDKSKF